MVVSKRDHPITSTLSYDLKKCAYWDFMFVLKQQKTEIFEMKNSGKNLVQENETF